jgi:hypothetical protein
MKPRHTLSVLLLLACAVQTSASFAGRSCEDAQIDPNKVMKGLELAQKTKLKLDDVQAELAIIARVGQDLSQYHLRYSHLGLARRETDGRWMVLHELNQCGTAESDLFVEGLGNFFMDDPFAFETLLLIPAPELQKKLLEAIDSGQARQLHQHHYNMLAFAFSTRYQNSNQWALEVLAAAQANEVKITQREQAQAWLKLAAYQPFDRRMAGLIDTVTVESISRFLQTRDPQLQKIVLSYP